MTTGLLLRSILQAMEWRQRGDTVHDKRGGFVCHLRGDDWWDRLHEAVRKAKAEQQLCVTCKAEHPNEAGYCAQCQADIDLVLPL